MRRRLHSEKFCVIRFGQPVLPAAIGHMMLRNAPLRMVAGIDPYTVGDGTIFPDLGVDDLYIARRIAVVAKNTVDKKGMFAERRPGPDPAVADAAAGMDIRSLAKPLPRRLRRRLRIMIYLLHNPLFDILKMILRIPVFPQEGREMMVTP